MKSSYKIALVVAAVVVVILVGYYLMPGGGAEGPGETGDAAATAEASRDRVASRRAPAAPPADADGTDDAAADPPGAQEDSSGSTNPLLAELRASLAAAKNQPGVTRPGDEPAPGTDAADSGADGDTGPGDAAASTDRMTSPEPVDEASASSESPLSQPDDPTARANDTLAIGPAAEAPTAAGSDQASGPAPRLAASNATPTITIGPEPGVPYFGPLPAPTPPAAARSTPAVSSASVTAGGAGGTYTIKANDTFASIAQALYHDQSRWVDIAKANPLVDPTKLKIGQEIRLPGSGAAGSRGVRGPDAAEAAAGADGARVPYVIRPNDTLSTIAQQFYGDPGKWRIIFDANRETLGNDPDRIRAGQTITIPPAPRGAQ